MNEDEKELFSHKNEHDDVFLKGAEVLTKGKNPEHTRSKRSALSAREVALEVLTRVEQDRSYSNLALHQSLEKHALERADAALATELVYGTIQRLNTIDYFLGCLLAKGIGSLQPWVRSLLRLSFYQLRYLDRVPAHAAVNEAVSIARRKGHQGVSGLVNAVLRNAVRRQEQLRIPDGLPEAARIALTHSHPEWLVARWISQYGAAETERICEANNRPPHTSARVNALRLSRDELLARMHCAGAAAEASALAPAGIVAAGGGNLAHTRWYRDGELTIQDESSMLVAEIVSPLPGMRVLDCCAAPGGKTTHLAELMQDRGEIIAVDQHEHKAKLISQQAERLGLASIRTIAADARSLTNRFASGSFDRVLLDAPCSGLGVIRRKPDLKWAKSERDIAEISALQRDILQSVESLLKPGGLLVYSTCTIEREENQDAVQAFLGAYPQYRPEASPIERLSSALNRQLTESGMVQILPHQYDSDGFFIARLRKGV